jgi:hypothetical protein
MSVVIYSWPQTIMSARTQAWTWGNPPFGIIFSSLMGASALGSFLSAYVSREGNSAQISSRTVQLALATSATALLLTLVSQSEVGRFWAFCLFELCVGMYLPSIAYLKDRLVQDERRNQLFALIRAPLNILVILCLTTISQGMLVYPTSSHLLTLQSRGPKPRGHIYDMQRPTSSHRYPCSSLCSEIK